MEMNATGGSRRDVHAGSWYSRDNKKLNAQLSEWLSRASTDRRHSRAIISPHAGYDYSGPTAAFAYNQICPDNVKRFFILGPSHYLGMSGKCALSSVDVFETPLYALQVDKDVYQELGRSGEFLRLSVASDEEEHSVEMQLPYVAKVMERRRGAFTIVPIVVGSLSSAREAVYGRILAPYLLNPENLFVISSDFCHWGLVYLSMVNSSKMIKDPVAWRYGDAVIDGSLWTEGHWTKQAKSWSQTGYEFQQQQVLCVVAI
ncbi:hypothetical protein CRM22_000854 [Opisthorchis felineus]|uniref:AmmeMemoRadiSam system protein B n=1 Tax=Opisthorchis felineus TaxID=147828 RepID=A0A4S2MJE5_OPIFE|nr:hypothetical protein CRM22_000854 [Opisthorchis felineus]TGZ74588.1 hypothetical protein CRM22_000854 [Opisthorchis felineus]